MNAPHNEAIKISRATLANLKQNLWGAFGYNTLGIPIAAGLAMSLSSVTVVSNADRLRLFRPSAAKRPASTTQTLHQTREAHS